MQAMDIRRMEHRQALSETAKTKSEIWRTGVFVLICTVCFILFCNVCVCVCVWFVLICTVFYIVF